jgi:hypothetical protein
MKTTRIKAKTSTPTSCAPKPSTVAVLLSRLDDLVSRAHATRGNAEVLAEAITGEVCSTMRDARDSERAPLVDALDALATSLSGALDGIDAALDKARGALG